MVLWLWISDQKNKIAGISDVASGLYLRDKDRSLVIGEELWIDLLRSHTERRSWGGLNI